MGDVDRPRERNRDRDSDGRRDAREDRRNRSRSPRRERGGRRERRYRSRSPVRRDDRERDRDRDRDHDGHRSDRRDRGDYHRNRSPPRGPRGAPNGPRSYNPQGREFKAGGPVKPPSAPRADIKPQPDHKSPVIKDERPKPDGMDDETWEMVKVMGFGNFKTTQNCKVPGNDKNYGVRKDKMRMARQYMNRPGGFNRPLSPSRS